MKENFSTKDALDKHIKRANYQCLVWKQALTPVPDLPNPINCGWVLKNGALEPELMSLAPITKACQELVTCSCRFGCGKKCSCFKAEQKLCTKACSCQGFCNNTVRNDYDSDMHDDREGNNY